MDTNNELVLQPAAQLQGGKAEAERKESKKERKREEGKNGV